MALNEVYQTNIDVIISVPIIGDKSIALLNPPKGFVFKEVSFEQYLFNKNMRNYNGHILIDYANALFSSPEKILVLEHQKNYTIELDTPIPVGIMELTPKEETDITNKLAVVKGELIKNLHDYFALLHIYKEGDVAYKEIFVRYAYGNKYIFRHRNHFDVITLNLKPMTIDSNEIVSINEFINAHTTALDMLTSVAVRDLICSYHCFYDSTNYKNMFTIFEVLLSSGEFDSDVLAKRIAVFIKNNDADIDATYKRFKELYLIRNNAVHRGEIIPITRDLLDELRNMVREVIKAYFLHIEKYMKFNKLATFIQAKKNCIKHLNVKVNSKTKWPKTKVRRTS